MNVIFMVIKVNSNCCKSHNGKNTDTLVVVHSISICYSEKNTIMNGGLIKILFLRVSTCYEEV